MNKICSQVNEEMQLDGITCPFKSTAAAYPGGQIEAVMNPHFISVPGRINTWSPLHWWAPCFSPGNLTSSTVLEMEELRVPEYKEVHK